MKRISAALLVCGLLCAAAQQHPVPSATAQQRNQEPGQAQDPADASQRALFSKIDASVICLNTLSERIYQSRDLYFSWAARSGPTGRESNIYGLYTFDNPADCREAVEMANDVAPHHPQLEDAASAYVNVVTKLYPLVKEAETYYANKNYQDDHMVRGRALHPPLLAAFDEFFAADQKLRDLIDPANDSRAHQRLAAIEKQAGRTLSYEVAALLFDARTLVNAIAAAPDTARLAAALSQYETSLTTVSTLDEAARNNGGRGIASTMLNDARDLLANAKIFMRRARDKTPYSAPDQMILRDFHLSGWMVKGSLPNLARSYNRMIDATNSGTISPTLKWIPLAPADARLKGAGRK